MSGKLWTFVIIAAIAASSPIVSTPGQAQSGSANPATQTHAPHVFGTVTGELTSLVRAARRAPQIEQLRLVNASLNDRIRYRHDPQPSGDHWSTAGETLSQSAGDCEDYVVAKFQALKAVGVPERDLFMTIGHDGFAGAVHAVLVVRARGQFFVLDNRTNQLIPERQYRGFYPIISFGARSSWLHGYERGKTPAAVRAINIALQSNRELALGNSRGSASPRAMRR